MRGPNKKSADVGNQLYDALKKKAEHTRVIFIEVNMPDDCNDTKAVETLTETLKSIRSREEKLTIEGQPAPPAYVIATNNPHQYSLNSPSHTAVLAEGFKIPDFKLGYRYASLREMLNNREKHIEIFSLMKSLEHSQIPATFDGDNPDLAFGNVEGRLKVGKRYSITDGHGGEVIGELQEAVVVESRKVAWGIYKLGRRPTNPCGMSFN